MFKKLDLIIDKLMDKTWFRVLFFTMMIINALFTIFGVLVLAVLTE